MTEEENYFKYYIASEKVQNLIFTIEQMMEYMQEYNIKPDEEVKKVLIPTIDAVKRWLND